MRRRDTYKALFLSLIVIMFSCDETEAPLEQEKNLDGSWKITSISRNEVDISESVDFSQFMIHFEVDNTYRIDNYIPFIVQEEGTWGLDDPKYPFKVNFRESSSTETIITNLTYPVVQGNRQIRLSFSPGCASNTYEYVLERVDP